jgi:hypothetical protein
MLLILFYFNIQRVNKIVYSFTIDSKCNILLLTQHN